MEFVLILHQNWPNQKQTMKNKHMAPSTITYASCNCKISKIANYEKYEVHGIKFDTQFIVFDVMQQQKKVGSTVFVSHNIILSDQKIKHHIVTNQN